MWMQILDAGGLQLIGDAFPRDWGETLRDANPHGFYESPLRRGVFYATNPHPKTGDYLPPDATRSVAVKVFIPGFCRTDHAYISKVVGTMRHWREYAASVERLRAMEDKAKAEKHDGDEAFEPPERIDPVLEWWLENFALIRNIVTRQLPAYLITYERVLENAEEVLPPILEWLGAENIEAAIDVVSPETRTQDRARIDREHPHEDVFDELYDIVQSSEPMTNDFLETMNETHQALIPAIQDDRERVMKGRRRRQLRRLTAKDVLHPDTLESLIHRYSIDE